MQLISQIYVTYWQRMLIRYKRLLLSIKFFYRPIPEKEFVEGYIKAYYLPESQLDSWLQDHKVLVSDILLKGQKIKINKAS